MQLRSVVLVERTSDRRAVETLARRRGRDLESEGVTVVAMGGYGNLPRVLERYRSVRLAGLYDIGEERHFLRALVAFRTYQRQPAHRDCPLEEQLHGFMWNRKQRYAVLLVEALDLERVPRPLDRVLAYLQDASPSLGH